MGNAELSAPVLARYQIEEAWRARLEQALERYQAATHAYRKLLREEAGGRPPSPDSPLVQARQAESDALMEYSRVLRIFTHLTIHGTLPDEALDVFAISSEEGAN